MDVRNNIGKVKERISSACAKAGRDPNSVTIVAVTKNRTVEEIEEVKAAGITDIGENRIQEALVKYCDKRLAISDKRVNWHLVGHLQTNKVKEAVKIFGLIHSVDSLRLAQEIDRQAAKINKVQDMLVEVNTSGEASKFGLKPDETIEVIKAISRLKNVNINGLMTIAPIVDNPEKARPYFKILRELRERIYERRMTNYERRILSMGMSDDFEVAIEEGATIVRIGRAIFEKQSIVNSR